MLFILHTKAVQDERSVGCVDERRVGNGFAGECFAKRRWDEDVTFVMGRMGFFRKGDVHRHAWYGQVEHPKEFKALDHKLVQPCKTHADPRR